MFEENPIVKDIKEQDNEIVDNTFTSEVDSDEIVIHYTRPKFFHRVLANLLDFILFVLMFFACFLLARKIVTGTSYYSSTLSSVNKMRVDSGMYYDDGTRLVDIVSYMRSNPDYNDQAIVILSEKNIVKFNNFEEPLVSAEKFANIQKEYDKLRLDATNDQGKHLFITVDNIIIKDPDLYEQRKAPYANFYCNYIDKYLQGYLSTTPQYYDAVKTLSNYLLWVEIPIGFLGGIIFVYLFPSLIFVRGRCTFGKALYRIGTVDSRFLSPTLLRNLAKWGIFTVEFIAGIASLGIIFILSTTMMAFSKNRQGFPDYMLGLQEVDMSKNKVFKNLDEIKLDDIRTDKKATDFRLINRP